MGPKFVASLIGAVCLVSFFVAYGEVDSALTDPAGAAAGTMNSTVPQSSYTNPALRNPVTSPTVPVSDYRRSTTRARYVVPNSSDLIVTGNVGGGRHFRDTVPYSSTTDFTGRFDSGTLDDFLRRSAISDSYYEGGITPFYSPTGTVTRTASQSNFVPEQSRKIRTGSTFLNEDPFIITEHTAPLLTQDQDFGSRLDRVKVFPQQGANLEEMGFERDLRDIKAAKRRLQAEDEQYAKDKGQFEKQVEAFRQKAKSLKMELIEDSNALPDTSNSEYARQYREQIESKGRADGLVATADKPKPVGVYEQMLIEYETLAEMNEALEEDGEAKDEQAEQEPVFKREKRLNYSREEGGSVQRKSKSVDKEPKTEEQIMANSQRLLSELSTFAAKTQGKFDKYMQSAEIYMSQGKYYKAADNYSMATIYKPLDPLGYAGRCHALFAAGDYRSSAAYLAAAIDIFPGYVNFNVDIIGMIGSLDTVEKRIADMKKWLEVSESGELEMLLAYVYMHMGRLEQASEAIDSAYKKMPDVPSVELLKRAIDSRR